LYNPTGKPNNCPRKRTKCPKKKRTKRPVCDTPKPTGCPTFKPTIPPTSPPTITPTVQRKCFESNLELRNAVLKGYSDNATPTGLSEVTSIYGPIETWCVDKVDDFSYIFSDSFPDTFEKFNEDISRWNTSNAKSMNLMFLNALSFNADLSQWDVSNVKDMFGMFLYAEKFNSNISGWDVSEVTDMAAMFIHAISFNIDISSWNVGKVKIMDVMFFEAFAFNQNLCNWNLYCSADVDKYKDIFLFSGCTSQNDPICPNSATFCQPCV
jgi:surface protein